MKQLFKLECPNCKAELEFTEKRKVMYCQYCGTKLLLDDDNEYTYRHIDEAEIKKAETEQLIRLKQLELAEKRYEENKKVTKLMILISLVVGAIGMISLIMAFTFDCVVCFLIFLIMSGIIALMWVWKAVVSVFKSLKKSKDF